MAMVARVFVRLNRAINVQMFPVFVAIPVYVGTV